MRVTVAPGQWPGETLPDTLGAVDWATDHGATGVWFSEVNGFDAAGLAALAAHRAPGVEVTLGPIVAGVRSAAQTAMAAATIGAVSEVAPRIALGAGNRRIVADWHGRDADTPARTMTDHIAALRQALAGDRTAVPGSSGFRLISPPPPTTIAVAALGPKMLEVAGTHADTLVLNLVPPAAVPSLLSVVASAAEKAGRRPPNTAVWMIVGAVEHSGPRVASFLRPYVTAEGYAPVLAAAGIATPLDPDAALATLTGLGPPEVAAERAARYLANGVDEIVAVGSPTDPDAARTVAALCAMVERTAPTKLTTHDREGTP